MKSLLTVTALIEIGAGLALLVVPAMAVNLLLGAPLEDAAAQIIARVGGAGLTALAVACWMARDETSNRAARGLVAGMLFYNVAAVAILGYAGLALKLVGLLLWPGVILHVAMAGWCAACLWKTPPRGHEG